MCTVPSPSMTGRHRQGAKDVTTLCYGLSASKELERSALAPRCAPVQASSPGTAGRGARQGSIVRLDERQKVLADGSFPASLAQEGLADVVRGCRVHRVFPMTGVYGRTIDDSWACWEVEASPPK